MGVLHELESKVPAALRPGSHDPLLGPFLSAESPRERTAALEELIVVHARPIIDRILSRYCHADGSLTAAEAEDLASTVVVRLVARLQSAVDGDAGIEHLADFTATAAYNAIHDLMRRRYPERTRLKNRIRYVVTHDTRFATRNTPAGLVCALAEHRPRLWPWKMPVDTNRDRPAEAVEAILRRAGEPLLLDAIVRTLAGLWNVTDVPRAAEPAATIDSHAERVESRQYLELLWHEIRELREPQRAALLLNLRDADGGNAVALLVMLGIGTLDEIAAAIAIPAERLAALWNDLPLDDLAIASMLGVTRQQVINLRKSARARLARRMKQP